MEQKQVEKLGLLMTRELDKVEQTIMIQQAMDKKLESLEQKRQELFAAHGLDGKTLKEIAESMQKMGGTLQICGKWLTAEKSRLHGAEVVSQDLRGGAALVSAALAAEGFSTIRQTELIERGYERFPETLRELGAKIIVEKEI